MGPQAGKVWEAGRKNVCLSTSPRRRQQIGVEGSAGFNHFCCREMSRAYGSQHLSPLLSPKHKRLIKQASTHKLSFWRRYWMGVDSSLGATRYLQIGDRKVGDAGI